MSTSIGSEISDRLRIRKRAWNVASWQLGGWNQWQCSKSSVLFCITSAERQVFIRVIFFHYVAGRSKCRSNSTGNAVSIELFIYYIILYILHIKPIIAFNLKNEKSPLFSKTNQFFIQLIIFITGSEIH